MRLGVLLLLGSTIGCSSESTGPATASDAAATVDEGTDTEPEDTNTTDTSGPPTFKAVHDVLTTRCGGGLCHGGSNAGWVLRGTVSATYSELVGPASSACTGLKRVEPGKPELSSLYLKVRGSFAGVCTGKPMPTGSTLKAAHVELIRSWIADGAKP